MKVIFEIIQLFYKKIIVCLDSTRSWAPFFSFSSIEASSVTNYISGGDDMFIATDAKQQRWNCLEKIPMKKEGPFFCLLCGKEVRLKKGVVDASSFCSR